jgi:hypothetical protein
MKPASMLLNQLLNVFWTVVCCLPVILYWVTADRMWLGPFLVISAMGLLVSSRSYLLSRNVRFYESLGVRWVRLFVQDGDLISRGRKKRATGQRIIRNKLTGRNYLKKIVMYEKFHFLCFLFFTLTTLHALVYGNLKMALISTGCNIIYNIYPLLLQQFNRIRVERIAVDAQDAADRFGPL